MPKGKKLKAETRVAVWVSPETRKKLNVKKAKEGYLNIESLVVNMLSGKAV